MTRLKALLLHQRIAALISDGITPRQMAPSLAVSLGVGVFPVLGTTAVLCTVTAIAMRLNLIAARSIQTEPTQS